MRAPSSNYLTTVDGLVTKTKDVPKMIFHCMLSQQRYARGVCHSGLLYLYLCFCLLGDQRLRGSMLRQPRTGYSPVKLQNKRYMSSAAVLPSSNNSSRFVDPYAHTCITELYANQDDPKLVEKWRKEVWQSY